MPGLQCVGPIAPIAQNDPAGHGAQSTLAALPVASEYVPASQSVGATAPVGQYPPGVQSSQAVWPMPFWKVPASQGLQVGALQFAATVPAAHGVGAVAPSEHALPGGQAWQPSCVVSPVVFPKLPASHGFATDEPAAQKPPIGQTTHAVAPSLS